PRPYPPDGAGGRAEGHRGPAGHRSATTAPRHERPRGGGAVEGVPEQRGDRRPPRAGGIQPLRRAPAPGGGRPRLQRRGEPAALAGPGGALGAGRGALRPQPAPPLAVTDRRRRCRPGPRAGAGRARRLGSTLVAPGGGSCAPVTAVDGGGGYWTGEAS